MIESALKRSILAVLREEPDLSQLSLLRRLGAGEAARLLRWLEISGLAFYVLRQLEDLGEVEQLPLALREPLRLKREANARRMDDMLAEFVRVNDCFRSSGIPHALLKGFTLFPDFSPARELRHQTDIDVLVSRADLREAGCALEPLGYDRVLSDSSDELRYASPRLSIPSASEDMYQIQPHREAELHTALWETAEKHHVTLSVPDDCLARSQSRVYMGVEFNALSLDDAFLLQLLHAFRHLLGSWIRLSWLWELHHFMRHNRQDTHLWEAVRSRAGDDPNVRNACGLILRLTHQIFGTPVPPILTQWCEVPLSARLRVWVDRFGSKWALVDMRGSKLALFAHADFISDPATRRRYIVRRMIPLAGRPSLGPVAARNAIARLKVRIARVRFSFRRLRFHVSSVAPLCIDFLRWRYALWAGSASRASRLPGIAAESLRDRG